jgi:hypothetical protein
MIYSNFQKLQNLVERIEIINPHRETISINEFQSIEKKISYELPNDYKYFCQKLGTGRASGFIDLYCMSEKAIENSYQATSDMVDRIDKSLVSKEKNHEYIKLLQKALIFASFNDDRVILWDLRTYDFKDGSYDIYWCDLYSPDLYEPIKIGRNFTDFICDFCYGQLVCSLIPDFCIDNEQMVVEYLFG